MKLAVFLAKGFEEIEALTVVDYLRRLDVDVHMISISDKELVKGAHDIWVTADMMISQIDINNYDGVVIPGGLPGATNLRDNKTVISKVKKMYDKGGLVASICAGPIVLEEAGIIKGKNITAYPGFEDELSGEYKDQNVVVDGNIITSQGPAIAVEFALTIAAYLLGEEKRKSLEEDILYPRLRRVENSKKKRWVKKKKNFKHY